MVTRAAIAICTPFYKRPEIANVYWHGVERLKRMWEGAGHTVVFVAGGEGEALRTLARAHNAHWLDVPNRPLGEKWNTICRAAVSLGASHILRLGSDDLLSPAAAGEYISALADGFHFAALRHLHMIEPSTRRALTVTAPGTTRMVAIGPGRMYGPAVLKATGGALCQPHPNKGMETSMGKVLQPLGFPSPDRMIEVGTVLDIKSSVNIWPYKTFTGMGPAVNYDQLLDEQFPEEAPLIRALSG